MARTKRAPDPVACTKVFEMDQDKMNKVAAKLLDDILKTENDQQLSMLLGKLLSLCQHNLAVAQYKKPAPNEFSIADTNGRTIPTAAQIRAKQNNLINSN